MATPRLACSCLALPGSPLVCLVALARGSPRRLRLLRLRANPGALVLELGDQGVGHLDVLAGSTLFRQIAPDRRRGRIAQPAVLLAVKAAEAPQFALGGKDELRGVRRRRLGRNARLPGFGRRQVIQQRDHVGPDTVAGRILQTLQVLPRPT